MPAGSKLFDPAPRALLSQLFAAPSRGDDRILRIVSITRPRFNYNPSLLNVPWQPDPVVLSQVRDLTDFLASGVLVAMPSGLTVEHFGATVDFFMEQLKHVEMATVLAIDIAVSKILKATLQNVTPESLQPAVRLLNDGVAFTFNAAIGTSTAEAIVLDFASMIKDKTGQHWQDVSEAVDSVTQTLIGNSWQSMLGTVAKHRAHRCSGWRELAALMRSAESAAFPISVQMLPNSTNKVALKHLEEIEQHCRASVPRESFTKAIAMSVMLKSTMGSVPCPRLRKLTVSRDAWSADCPFKVLGLAA